MFDALLPKKKKKKKKKREKKDEGHRSRLINVENQSMGHISVTIWSIDFIFGTKVQPIKAHFHDTDHVMIDWFKAQLPILAFCLKNEKKMV